MPAYSSAVSVPSVPLTKKKKQKTECVLFRSREVK